MLGGVSNYYYSFHSNYELFPQPMFTAFGGNQPPSEFESWQYHGGLIGTLPPSSASRASSSQCPASRRTESGESFHDGSFHGSNSHHILLTVTCTTSSLCFSTVSILYLHRTILLRFRAQENRCRLTKYEQNIVKSSPAVIIGGERISPKSMLSQGATLRAG